MYYILYILYIIHSPYNVVNLKASVFFSERLTINETSSGQRFTLVKHVSRAFGDDFFALNSFRAKVNDFKAAHLMSGFQPV